MFAKWGRLVVRRAWWVIGGWLTAAALIIGLLPSLADITSADQGSFLPAEYESVEAAHLSAAAFGQKTGSTAVVVVQRTDHAPLTEADEGQVAALASALAMANVAHTGTASTGPEAIAPNRSVQLINVPITAESQDSESQLKAVTGIRNVIGARLSGTGLSAGVAGTAAQALDNDKTFKRALAAVGIATFLLIIALILVIFRSPIAAVLPIIVIGAVMEVSSRLVALTGKIFDFNVDQSVQTLLLIVLYGIGTDYLLFLLFRYRERLRAGEDRRTAMVNAVERIGEVITSAAAAVIVAFLVLVLAQFGVFNSLGLALAIAVFVMLVTALTLIPAVVSLIGPMVFWPSKTWRRPPRGLFPRIGAAVGRRPLPAAVCSALILLALAAGVVNFKADYDFTAGFPSSTESAQAAKDLERGFPPGALNPTQAYLRSTNGAELTPSQLTEFRTASAELAGVGEVLPPVKAPNGSVARYAVLLSGNPASNETIALLKDSLRHQGPRRPPRRGYGLSRRSGAPRSPPRWRRAG
ncbi:MMPL family transporter [Micromonospora sp. CNB394]|uniref:MMPL family transporter n=1 Tax=Micromonospora sp. CNB394 TaxID=1169151 RepID=UPI0006887AFC|nr:MMPL family transporter [Micromonospora sp. CNB394]